MSVGNRFSAAGSPLLLGGAGGGLDGLPIPVDDFAVTVIAVPALEDAGVGIDVEVMALAYGAGADVVLAHSFERTKLFELLLCDFHRIKQDTFLMRLCRGSIFSRRIRKL